MAFWPPAAEGTPRPRRSARRAARGLALACLLGALPCGRHVVPAGRRAWAEGPSIVRWPRSGSFRVPATARAATAGPGTLAGEEEEELERPRYSWCETARPKPIDMGGRRGTDVPRGWNPLLDSVGGMPRYGEVRPEHLVNGMHMTVDQFGNDLERYQVNMNLCATRPSRLTWERFAEPLEQMLDSVERVWSAIGLLREVNDTSADFHLAYNNLVVLLRRVALILAQSDDIYEVMRLLTYSPKLTEAQRRIVDKYMLQSWQAGIGLQEAATSKRFCRNLEELAFWGDIFANNVAADEEQVVLRSDSAEELAGLPLSIKEVAAETARASGLAAATAETGPWLLRLSPGERRAVLETSENRELRREVYLASTRLAWRNATRAKDGAPAGDNTRVVEKILELRHYWARNISYESYADMAFTNRMASVRQVDAFLASLEKASLPAARAELQELQAFARLAGEAEELAPWDVAFWRGRLRRERLGAAEEDLRQHLALPAVLGGLFGLLRRLFGLEVVESSAEAPTWDESVRFFRVVDAKTRVPLGGFYFDAYRAPRKRRAGFWSDRALGYSKLLGAQGGHRRPVVHIAGDVEPPGEGPALMAWPQVLSLFRAMGHALQELLAEQEEGLAAGTKCMEIDAAGYPPRLLELFAYDPATLRSLGLPETMVDAIVASQSFHSGSRLLDEVRLARLDLELHARYDPEGSETPWELARRIEEQLAVQPSAVEEHRLCRLTGPFATGHAAGHYAELWAQVLAADAFEAFQEAGTEDDEAVRRLGGLLRASVLAPGGGRAPLAAFRDFRGRIPRVAALLRRLGLSRGGQPAASEPEAPAVPVEASVTA